jgi:hypothetical protein
MAALPWKAQLKCFKHAKSVRAGAQAIINSTNQLDDAFGKALSEIESWQ